MHNSAIGGRIKIVLRYVVLLYALLGLPLVTLRYVRLRCAITRLPCDILRSVHWVMCGCAASRYTTLDHAMSGYPEIFHVTLLYAPVRDVTSEYVRLSCAMIR